MARAGELERQTWDHALSSPEAAGAATAAGGGGRIEPGVAAGSIDSDQPDVVGTGNHGTAVCKKVKLGTSIYSHSSVPC